MLKYRISKSETNSNNRDPKNKTEVGPREDFGFGSFEIFKERRIFMKKLLILCINLAILSYSLTLWCQDKTEAPELKIGDIWTYQTSKGGNFKYEVVQITEEGYVIKYAEKSYIYDKNTLNLKFVIDGSKKTKPESPIWKIFDFPLFVGKKWKSDTPLRDPRTGAMYSVGTEYQVEALEDVQTPAGIFRAFRILGKFFIAELRREFWSKLWYSPEAKYWIKREIDKGIVTKDEDAVLASYKLKER
jgi:hypothetical protein